jgi:uncharacterized membrane protein
VAGAIIRLNGEIHPFMTWVGWLLFTMLFGAPTAYLAMGILGWPCVVVLKRYQRLHLMEVSIASAIIGAIVFPAFVAAILIGETTRALLTVHAPIGVATGITAALIFSSIAGLPVQKWGRPTRRSGI